MVFNFACVNFARIFIRDTLISPFKFLQSRKSRNLITNKVVSVIIISNNNNNYYNNNNNYVKLDFT